MIPPAPEGTVENARARTQRFPAGFRWRKQMHPTDRQTERSCLLTTTLDPRFAAAAAAPSVDKDRNEANRRAALRRHFVLATVPAPVHVFETVAAAAVVVVVAGIAN